jgi:hypothetical protein
MRASLRDYVAAYNTMISLKKTEDSMSKSGGSLESTVVEASDNSAEVFAAFELQSKEFQNVQTDFENYMERLKEDIDNKAEKFEHIDYYDALLRDGHSKDTAVAAGELHQLDERRKPLISINPLFAKVSEMPPLPSIEDLTYEHISLNLPAIAKNALNDLAQDLVVGTANSEQEHIIPENEIEPYVGIESDEELNFDDLTSPNHEITQNEEGIEINEDVNMEIPQNGYTVEILQKLTDNELSEILNDVYPWAVPNNDFNREEYIEAILEAQANEGEMEENKEDEGYTIVALEKLTESELQDMLVEWGFEPMENFDKEEAIAAILQAQEVARKGDDEDNNKVNN